MRPSGIYAIHLEWIRLSICAKVWLPHAIVLFPVPYPYYSVRIALQQIITLKGSWNNVILSRGSSSIALELFGLPILIGTSRRGSSWASMKADVLMIPQDGRLGLVDAAYRVHFAQFRPSGLCFHSGSAIFPESVPSASYSRSWLDTSVSPPLGCQHALYTKDTTQRKATELKETLGN